MKTLLGLLFLCGTLGAYEGELYRGMLVTWPQDAINVCIDPSVPPSVCLAVKRATKSACRSWTRVLSRRRIFRLTADPALANITIVWGSMAAPHTGYTTLETNIDGNILSARIVLSDAIQDGWPQLWFDGLLLHEMGHAVGLYHSDQNPSCMNPSLWRYIRHPCPDDIHGARWLYGLTF